MFWGRNKQIKYQIRVVANCDLRIWVLGVLQYQHVTLFPSQNQKSQHVQTKNSVFNLFNLYLLITIIRITKVITCTLINSQLIKIYIKTWGYTVHFSSSWGDEKPSLWLVKDTVNNSSFFCLLVVWWMFLFCERTVKKLVRKDWLVFCLTCLQDKNDSHDRDG